jgi:hypothetical protein
LFPQPQLLPQQSLLPQPKRMMIRMTSQSVLLLQELQNMIAPFLRTMACAVPPGCAAAGRLSAFAASAAPFARRSCYPMLKPDPVSLFRPEGVSHGRRT